MQEGELLFQFMPPLLSPGRPSTGPLGYCLVCIRSTANQIKSFHQHSLYRYTPIAPLQVFGPSVGLVGDCIALCPLDHFVRVRSTANRIKSFRQDLCLRTASHPMKKL